MKISIASAPGKILWIGGYSVLERPNVSFVTGVNKRVYARVETSKENKIVFDLPQFRLKLEGRIDNEKIVFDKQLSEQEASVIKFVKIATETCIKYLKGKGKRIIGFKLTTISDPAFSVEGSKAGLGSSAAVTTATVGAILQAYGFKIDKSRELIHKIAQFAHSKAQGKVGSGFDVAASTYGGHSYVRYSPSIINDVSDDPTIEQVVSVIDKKWDYLVQQLELPPKFVPVIGNFIGESASTSAMVKQVNAFKEAQPEQYKQLMIELNGANQLAIAALSEINKLSKQNPEKYGLVLKVASKKRKSRLTEGLKNDLKVFNDFREAFDKGRLLTKKLGELSGAPIEPSEYSELIEDTKKNGAFVAKLPGAGGGDAIAAICLSKRSKKKVEDFWRSYQKKKINPLNLSISNEGVRKENKKTFKKMINLISIQ
ncbi:MAG: hypothetical protein ACP5H8_00510 [Candidatus Micrarchaeia archaeon]